MVVLGGGLLLMSEAPLHLKDSSHRAPPVKEQGSQCMYMGSSKLRSHHLEGSDVRALKIKVRKKRLIVVWIGKVANRGI